MIIRSLKFSTKLILILSILFVLSSVSLFAWIVTAPRSLSSITPSIERELSSISEDVDVKITESHIKWDSDEHAIVIEAIDISVINKEKKPIARFPKIAFDFSVLKFLSGNIVSSDITLINPSFYIDTTQKSLYMDFKNKEEGGESALDGILDSIKAGKYNFPVNSLRIKNADIFISNGFSDFLWQADDGYIRINKKSKVLSELNLKFGKYKTYIGTEISYKEGVYDNKVSFRNLPSFILSDIFPTNDFLKNINIESSGNVRLLISEKAEVEQASFNIDDLKGGVELFTFFPNKFNVVGAKAKGSFYNNFSSLALDNLDAKIDDSIVLVSGNFSNLLPSPDFAPAIDADVTVKNFRVDDLNRYWPFLLGKKVRTWILANVTGAEVAKASGSFNFSPDYFKRMYEWKRGGKKTPIPRMDENSIDSIIEVKNAKVTYKDPYPNVEEISGLVKLTSRTFRAEVNSAKIGDSKVGKSIVEIENMYQKNPPLKISGEFDGYVRDSIAFLKPALKKQKLTEYLDSIYHSTGTVSGTAKISFPITKELEYEQFNLELDTRFAGVKFPAFINGHDVTNSVFDLKLKDNKLDVSGKFNVLDETLDVKYNKDINDSKSADYSIKGNITPEKISSLGVAELPFVENYIGLDVKIRERKNSTYINGEVDLTKAKISISKANFLKNENEKAKATFVLKKNVSEDVAELNIKSFVLTGDDMRVNGKLNIYDSVLQSMEIEEAQYANNNFSLSYKLKNNKHYADLKGKKLDFSDVSFAKFFDKDEGKDKQSYNVKAKVDSVMMKSSEQFSDLTLDMDCSDKFCSSINAYAKAANDAFIVLSVKPVGESYSVMLETDNAGSVINAFGLSKHIKDGRLTVESTFSKDASGTIAQGLIQIHDFKAVKTPILGKLLTLASLKGISDLLNNKGIAFERFAAPFHISKGVITLHDAKTAGSSIGITSEGTIDMNSGHIDLNGAIVPAYEVNRVLGDIPILGNLIVGKKNEGVIATKYRIKGPYDNTKITVNPLTILTPGFLRNIFDIF